MKEPRLYRILRPILKVFIKLYRPTYIGVENIPLEGRIVLAGNHTSYFDPLLLISCTKRTIHFLAKDSLVKGFKKIIFSNMGLIPVNRKIHDKEALHCAINYLNDGRVIGIFPEGTISKNDDLLPFKIGAVKMSKETNTKIVPFIIHGKYKLFRKSVSIEFLKPIVIKDNDLDKENKKLRDMINNNLNEKRK